MLNHDDVMDHTQLKNELGVVICKVCDEVMYTLPTNGVKRIPGRCAKEECLTTTIYSGGEAYDG